MTAAPTFEEGTTLWDVAQRRAAATPEAVVVVDMSGAELRAGELVRRAERTAAALAQRHVGPGTVVSWQLPTWPEAVILSVALSRLGAVQNPLVPILGRREVTFICRQAHSDLLVVPGVWRGTDYPAVAAAVGAELSGLDVLVVDRALPEADPSMLPPPPRRDPLPTWLFYTSGTTAEPKGARHRDHHLLVAATGMCDALEINRDDRFALIAPITHIGGIIQLLGALMTGCQLLAVEVFQPEPVIEFFRARGVTLVGLGTPTFRAYLDYQEAHPELAPLFPSARAFASGGAPTPPALHYRLRAALGTVGIVSGWGLTEAPMLSWNSVRDSDGELAGTEGRPLPGVEVVVVGLDGTPRGAGQEGELRIKAPQRMLGYVDVALDDDAFDTEGYFRTGDLGCLDERGNIIITGRSKDVIIRNMENISALEVETLLFTHPFVAEVAVVGVPDPTTGERACAVVVPSGGLPTLDDLCAHLLAAGLSRRKLPEHLVIVDVLPRNAMGKLVKADVRRQVMDSSKPGPAT